MTEMQELYVRRQGRIDGPWSVSKLKSEVALRKLGRHHEISEDGSTWRRAGELSELFPAEAKRKIVGKPVTSHGLIAAEAVDGSSDGWYYCLDGEQKGGPLAASQLAQMVLSGQCPLDAYIWREGYGDWLPLEDVPEIASLLEAVNAGGGAETTATRMIQTAATRMVQTAAGTPRAKFAPWALACGLGALFFSWIPLAGFAGLLAMGLGVATLREVRRGQGQPRDTHLAIAAIATGAFAMFVGLIVFVLLVVMLLG